METTSAAPRAINNAPRSLTIKLSVCMALWTLPIAALLIAISQAKSTIEIAVMTGILAAICGSISACIFLRSCAGPVILAGLVVLLMTLNVQTALQAHGHTLSVLNLIALTYYSLLLIASASAIALIRRSRFSKSSRIG